MDISIGNAGKGKYCSKAGECRHAFGTREDADDDKSEFYTPDSKNRVFTIPSNPSGYTVEQYHIDLSASIPSLQSAGTDITVNSGVTSFNVSTTENPIFLKFISQ